MIEFTLDLGNSHWERGRHSLLFTHSSRTGASKIIVPLPSALSPDLKRIRQTGINRSPAIPKIPNNPVNPASDNVHQEIWDRPRLRGASQIIVPLQSALSLNAKRIRSTGISRLPAIPKIPNNLVNPASDNVHQEIWDRPRLRGASQIIVPLPSALSLHTKRIRSTGINRLPAILKIPNNPVNSASDNVHQEIRDRPRLRRASQIIVPPQSALSPDLKKIRQTGISQLPAIPKIPNNPVNPASDNVHKKYGTDPGCRGISNYRPSAIYALTRRKKDPLNRHQPIACNPENPQ